MLLWSSSHSCRTTSNENLSWRKKAALNCTITLRGSEKLGTVTLYLFLALEPTTSVSILLKEESGLSVAALDVNPDDLRANQYWSIPGSVQKQGSISCEAERDDIIISRPFRYSTCDGLSLSIDRKKYVSDSLPWLLPVRTLWILPRPKGG